MTSEATPQPTPEEIAEACREIQEGWTEEDFFKKSGRIVRDYEAPTVRLGCEQPHDS